MAASSDQLITLAVAIVGAFAVGGAPIVVALINRTGRAATTDTVPRAEVDRLRDDLDRLRDDLDRTRAQRDEALQRLARRPR